MPVSLEELGIPHVKVKRVRTEGLILGFLGENAAKKADRLAERLSRVVAVRGIRVTRPSQRLDLHLAGIAISMSIEEIMAASAGDAEKETSDAEDSVDHPPTVRRWHGCSV